MKIKKEIIEKSKVNLKEESYFLLYIISLFIILILLILVYYTSWIIQDIFVILTLFQCFIFLKGLNSHIKYLRSLRKLGGLND